MRNPSPLLRLIRQSFFRRAAVLLTCAGLLALPAAGAAARSGARDATLQPIDPAVIAAVLAAVPAPVVVDGEIGTDARASRAPAGSSDPNDIIAARAGDPAPLAGADQRTEIDTFERPDWPAGSAGDHRWLPQTLIDLAQPAGGHRWASSTCQAAGGQRSLCPFCGGPAGAQVRCGDPHPVATSPSVLLRLDLSKAQNMERLDLVMDVWADASPHEGLFVDYVEYDPAGDVAQRRVIYSATGQLRAWAPRQRLNLLAVRDPLDPTWRATLAGRVVYLEFLFYSDQAGPNGGGIFVDNLALESRAATIPVTPVPTPSVGAVYCPAGSMCGSLQVEAFVDYRCDGNYQSGVDRKIGRQWVEALAGGFPLGAFTKPSGTVFFRLPIDQPVAVSFTVPAGHKMCANSPNPLTLVTSDFGRSQRKKIRFRVVPIR